MSGICAEYIWIDGTKPTPQLRSKTKIMTCQINTIRSEHLAMWPD